MSRLLRITLIILGTSVAVIVSAVVALFVIIDPDQYRQAIEEAAFEATGLELNIAGDVAVTWQPYVGVTLNDVRLRNPERPQELASSSLVSLRVNPRELLSGHLLVEELRADNFHFNWYVDADGNSLWTTERLRQLQGAASGQNSDAESALTTRFNFISIANASVDIQNLQQGYYYSVRGLGINSQDSNASGQPFPVQASFDLVFPTAPRPWPVTLSTTGSMNLESGELSLGDIQLALTPALLEGEIRLQDLFGQPDWQAQLTTSEFALDDLLVNLFGEAEPMAEPRLPGFRENAIWRARLQASISGDRTGIELPELVVTLGDMQMEMDANVRFANGLLPTNARFNVQTSALDLSPYLPAGNSQPETEPGENEQADQVVVSDDQETGFLASLTVPDSLRSGVNVQGSVSIGSLFTGNLQFGNLTLFTNLESGILDIELQPSILLGGSVEGNLRLNSAVALPEVTLDLFASDINAADLPLPLVVPGTFAGRLSQESHYSGTGTTLADWIESVSGATGFSVADSSVDIGLLKQVFTAISVLSPTGEAFESWPDDIRFNELRGYVISATGMETNQQIKVRLDNFDIAGTGGINLDEQRFAYDLAFTLLGAPFAQTIPINQRYQNVSWPVQCRAGFEEPVNRFCRPDLAQVRDIYTQLDNGTLTIQYDKLILDQVPEALQTFTSGLLVNLLQGPALLPLPLEQAPLPVRDLAPDQNPLSDQNLPPDQMLQPGQNLNAEPGTSPDTGNF